MCDSNQFDESDIIDKQIVRDSYVCLHCNVNSCDGHCRVASCGCCMYPDDTVDDLICFHTYNLKSYPLESDSCNSDCVTDCCASDSD